jgi:hypothetical protein
VSDEPRVVEQAPERQLAAAAVDAWYREETDLPVCGESDRQRMLRDHAATLALIGLAVERDGQQHHRDGVTVRLSPDLVRAALAAVDVSPGHTIADTPGH